MKQLKCALILLIIKGFFFPFLLFSTSYPPQDISLEEQILSVTGKKDATVGVAVIFDGKDTLVLNNAHPYPMMSVYKFHQALSVLDYLEKNGKSLHEEIFIPATALLPDTYSPLRDSYPEGNFHMSVRELLEYSVCKSDNNACDILFHYIGGPHVTESYIHSLGLKDIRIIATEEEMHGENGNEYLNFTTPLAAAELMEIFLNRSLFSDYHQQFLTELLIKTSTGPNKIKGLLPEGTIVGHKTGTSSRTETGLRIADNDLGFIVFPSGKKCSIGVFVMNSMETDSINASMSAEISKIVYDYFLTK